MNNQSEIKAISLKNAFKHGAFKNFNNEFKVSNSENQIPYVTLLHGNKALNLFCGQKTSEKIDINAPVSEQIANAIVVLSTNAQGEERLKLSLSGETSYVSGASVFGDIAGLSENELEVLNFMKAEMQDVEGNNLLGRKVQEQASVEAE